MKFLKKTFSLLLILILFFHVNYLAVYYSLYLLNIEELTQSCCKKLTDDCNAKCYVEQKMDEENNSKNKKESPEMKLKIAEFHVPFSEIILHKTENNILYTQTDNTRLSGYISDTDHPPRS